ncbi:MAG TPA: ribonuclease Z [Miltoncostaeaceae bacterium]|nr:ribonuclease Z [Miltoncostaeaceae bacterium]
MDLSVTFIGTAASVPTAARGVAATLVARGGERWLIDCGEGTQRQLLRSGQGLVDLDVILITHLHGDHILGLPGILKTFGLRARERPLRLAGPRGLARLMETLRPVVGRTPFVLELQELDEREVSAAWRGDGVEVRAFPTRHSIPSVGYAMVEEDRPGEFDVGAARALGVTPGPDFGVLQRGGEVVTAAGRTVRPDEVLGVPRRGRTVVITGDTEPCAGTLEAARGADLLVHEATFIDEERDRARETRHSTAREAAALAKEAGVALLALTHLSSRFMPRDIRAEAQAVFPGVVVPRDFDRIEVPFPERGAPVLHPAKGGGERRGAPDVASDPPATVPPGTTL